MSWLLASESYPATLVPGRSDSIAWRIWLQPDSPRRHLRVAPHCGTCVMEVAPGASSPWPGALSVGRLIFARER